MGWALGLCAESAFPCWSLHNMRSPTERTLAYFHVKKWTNRNASLCVRPSAGKPPSPQQSPQSGHWILPHPTATQRFNAASVHATSATAVHQFCKRVSRIGVKRIALHVIRLSLLPRNSHICFLLLYFVTLVLQCAGCCVIADQRFGAAPSLPDPRHQWAGPRHQGLGADRARTDAARRPQNGNRLFTGDWAHCIQHLRKEG